MEGCIESGVDFLKNCQKGLLVLHLLHLLHHPSEKLNIESYCYEFSRICQKKPKTLHGPTLAIRDVGKKSGFG